MHMNRVDKTNEGIKIIGLEEAEMWWKSIIGCFENPTEACEQLRQFHCGVRPNFKH